MPVEISRGPQDAKVTIVEYGDFNCPACKAYHEAGIIDQVLARYPSDVRFVFRHFPVITYASPQLAEAAECAYDQNAFWQFHDLLYINGPSSAGDMSDYASQLGLDMERFDRCTDTRQYAGMVDDQLREAVQLGFRGTPSFVVNNTPLAGPPGFSQLVGMIEEALAGGT
jgi:protein-disulfide isomerase